MNIQAIEFLKRNKYKPQKGLILPILILFPFLLLMVLSVVHYGVNTPYYDEWDMVPLFQKVDHHELFFKDLWAQHNEHRIVFPKIVILMAAYITHWNIKAELLISICFAVASVCLLYLMVIKKINNKRLKVAALTLVTILFFSPVQWDNWLWGWQVEWFMCITFILLSIFLLNELADTRKVKIVFTLALLAAFGATFSLGSGIVIWAIGLFILLTQKLKKPILLGWVGAAVFSTVLYYYHYHKPAGSPSKTIFLHEPVAFIRYLFAFFGRPVSDIIEVATLTGSIFLFLGATLFYLAHQRRTQIKKFLPWLSIMIFAILAGCITAVSRLGFGVEQSMSSRYTAISLLYLIGLVGLSASLLDRDTRTKKSKRETKNFWTMSLVFVSCICPLVFSSYVNGVHGLQQRSVFYKELKNCTAKAHPSKECMASAFPVPQLGTNWLLYIKEKHWAGY